MYWKLSDSMRIAEVSTSDHPYFQQAGTKKVVVEFLDEFGIAVMHHVIYANESEISLENLDPAKKFLATIYGHLANELAG